MNSEGHIRDYFYSQYGLFLNDQQARKFRNIIGDMEGFIEFVSRKLGLGGGDDGELDVKWARRVLPTSAYPSLEKDDESVLRECRAPQDFQQMVLDPLEAGREQEAYEGVIEWLSACVDATGLTTLRGAMARRSNAKMEKYGIKPPRKGGKKRQSKLDFLTGDAGETIALVLDRLRGPQSQQFASRVGDGSPRHAEIVSSFSERQSADAEHAFEVAMLDSMVALDSAQYARRSAALRDWLLSWATDDGMKYLRSALVNKRHQEKRDGEVVLVSKADREYLETIRDRYGYISLKDAIGHVVDTSRKLESAR